MSKVYSGVLDQKYQAFFNKYKQAHPDKPGIAVTAEVVKIWKEKLNRGKDEELYKSEMVALEEKVQKVQRKGNICSFFRKQTKAAGEASKPDKTKEPDPAPIIEVVQEIVEEEDSDKIDKRKLTPAQDKLQKLISIKEKSLSNLIEERAIDQGSNAVSLAKQIKNTRDSLKKHKVDLKRAINLQNATNRYRAKRKKTEERLKADHPEFARCLKLQDAPGRPRIECDNPGILETLLEIATVGAACGDRRREDVFRTVKTLDDLTKALHSLGYMVSRSALYLRLLPRCQTSQEGRLHVKTLPVKLIRPQNDLRKKHPDRIFAAETSKAADAIAAFLGPEACIHASQDDKSSVPIGRTAAKKQAPLLMSMRVRVRLPDHDFVVGSRHLLVPSVIAHCRIDPGQGVTYTGETYIAVRSSKHNNSSAFSHQQDMLRMKEMMPEIFAGKSVLIKGVDGGPDENPRFQNNQLMAIKTFQVIVFPGCLSICPHIFFIFLLFRIWN